MLFDWTIFVLRSPSRSLAPQPLLFPGRHQAKNKNITSFILSVPPFKKLMRAVLFFRRSGTPVPSASSTISSWSTEWRLSERGAEIFTGSCRILSLVEGIYIHDPSRKATRCFLAMTKIRLYLKARESGRQFSPTKNFTFAIYLVMLFTKSESNSWSISEQSYGHLFEHSFAFIRILISRI
ncbi:hypothetical protein ABKN59_009432 [Abortiporus biennis]